MTIADVAPSIEDKSNQMIVDKTLSIDKDDNKINSPSGDETLMSHKELEHSLDDSKIQASLPTSPWTAKHPPAPTSSKSRLRFRR
eukprot:6944226-Ditylum_brightwellii.AAC.1